MGIVHHPRPCALGQGRLNGTYKAELNRAGSPWRTRHQAALATIEWIDWYDTARLHGEIGHIPPLEG
ncbi:MAG: integrase core domain-containing protein [Acidimicrobiales bacterium]